jgi:multidrug efflux system outer membrane protein
MNEKPIMMKNPMIKYSPVLLLLLFISACRIGKNYQRPELELPAQFSQVSVSDTSSIADIQWSTFFTDATLRGLIQKGISYNQDLLIALKRLDAADQVAKQAKLLLLPELNLQVTGQYNHPSKNSLNGISANNFLGTSHLENYQAIVNFNWEIDIWGKIRRQKETALADYLRTKEAAKAVQTQLVANIARQYYNLLMLDKQLEVAHKNLALSDTFLRATSLLKDAGMVNALAVQQAEVQRQSTALLVPQLEKNIALQENALQILTGQLPNAIARKTSLNDIAVREDLNTGLPAVMVSRRPDIRTAELALVAANARVGVAQANMYPALNITAGAGLESFKSSNWFSIPNSLFGLAAGTIAQPVFNRRRLKTQFEVAKIEREQAVIQFRQAVLFAVGEVADALVKIDKLKTEKDIVTSRVQTLQQTISNANMLFKNGMADYLEVITAQSNMLQSELDLAATRKEQLNAVIDLYRSLGGGWQ